MNYSVVITNWNGADVLKKNIPKVAAATSEALELIVVDDCSTDNSVKVLEDLTKKFKNLKIIKKEKNEGFSSTTNLGVKSARGDLVLLLNSDVIPRPGFLKPVWPLFQNEKLFAVGLHDLSFEKDGRVVSRGRGVGKFIRGYLMHRPGKITSGPSLWASCGSGLFRRDLWLKIGGLDTIYNPAYGEDWDLGYRAWKKGFEILFEENAVVEHRHEEGALRKRYSPFYRRSITFRNQNIFIIKNIGDPKFILSYLLFLPYHLVYQAIKYSDLAFWYGYLLFLINILTIKRPEFIKTDAEIIAKFSPEFEMKNEEIF